MPTPFGVEHLDTENAVLAEGNDFRVHRARMDMDDLPAFPIDDPEAALRVGRGIEETQQRCLKIDLCLVFISLRRCHRQQNGKRCDGESPNW
jgi:hypothetical protein